MKQPWRTGKVIKIADETSNTKRFWIQVPELESFDFEPGQFVTLDLPIHEKPNKRWRSYSIASWPDGSNVFELVIVLLEGGLGTTYLFNEVSVGSELLFRGAQGVFTLHEELDRPLFLICTGTGIAPFRSMTHHLQSKGIKHNNIHLVFGCRTKKDLLYYEELRQLEKEERGFHYHPVLSREEWEEGDTGYVHDVYVRILEKYRAESGSSEAPPAYFYLCGWKNMIDEARKTFAEMGYDKKSVHFELYG